MNTVTFSTTGTTDNNTLLALLLETRDKISANVRAAVAYADGEEAPYADYLRRVDHHDLILRYDLITRILDGIPGGHELATKNGLYY